VQLSKLVGVGYATLSAYEAGISVPASKTFKKLKLVLKLNGEHSDFFSHVKRTGRKKKYQPGAICTHEGCDRIPAAKGLCMTHYVNIWRKKKVQEQKRMMHVVCEALAKSQKEVKENSS
jgi:hypothetical protein